MRSVGLVVPLFDEADRFTEFGGLLLDFVAGRPAGSELVFVDDGSTDGTARLVEELLAVRPDVPARLLRRPHLGKGAAVAAGIATLDTAYAGFCDLDLSTPLDQFERVLATALREPVLAIGSRDLAASRIIRPESRIREGLGRTYNRLLQATVTPGVADTQCGAKAGASQIWRNVLPRCSERGYAWDAEVIAVTAALGIGIREVPIEWRHDDRTKVRLLRDGAAMVAATPRVWRSARRAARSAPAGAGSAAPGGSR